MAYDIFLRQKGVPSPPLISEDRKKGVLPDLYPTWLRGEEVSEML